MTKTQENKAYKKLGKICTDALNNIIAIKSSKNKQKVLKNERKWYNNDNCPLYCGCVNVCDGKNDRNSFSLIITEIKWKNLWLDTQKNRQ